MKKFKCRASKLGDLFTNPRNKGEVISETAKSYLKEWVIEQKFGVKKEIISRYLDKGLYLEDEAIKHYNKLFKTNAEKNDEFFENEYIQGTPDLIIDGKIVDIKCSFSAFSFPMFDKELPTKAYYYQLQAYMWLTGCKEAEVAYFLLDSPDDVILREAKSIMYKEQLPDDFLDILIEEVKESHTFQDIPIKDRCKVFKMERNEEVIAEIARRVLNARDYIETIK
jgi:hypothetical protein